MEQKTLTQEELQQLKEVKETIVAIASGLGELEYQKTLIDLDVTALKDQVRAIKGKEQELLKGFGEKYGNGVINLETGEIDPRP